jgi:hypothetical protein
VRLADHVADREICNKNVIGKGNGQIAYGRSTLTGAMMLFKNLH